MLQRSGKKGERLKKRLEKRLEKRGNTQIEILVNVNLSSYKPTISPAARTCTFCVGHYVCYSEAERKEEAKKRLEKRLEKRENT